MRFNIREVGVQGDFSSNFERVTIRDGVMVVRDTEPVVFQNLELEEDGTIVVGLSKSDPSSRTSDLRRLL